MSTFSIDAFRASFINGIARNNLFLVQGNFPGSATSAVQGVAGIVGSGVGAAAAGTINTIAAVAGGGSPSSQVSFLCKASKVPSSTLNIDTASYMGRQYKYPGNRTFADWSITCYNDGTYGLRKSFESWMNIIGSNKTNVGPNEMIQFMTDWTVTPLTREGLPIATYKLVGCWPSTISETTLDMAGSGEPSTFDVTIAYQYFEIENITT